MAKHEAASQWVVLNGKPEASAATPSRMVARPIHSVSDRENNPKR